MVILTIFFSGPVLQEKASKSNDSEEKRVRGPEVKSEEAKQE